MTAAEYASFSNNAIAFASIVYALALMSHIAEWAFGRSVPADVAVAEQPATRQASVAAQAETPVAAGVSTGAMSPDAAPTAPTAGPAAGPTAGSVSGGASDTAPGSPSAGGGADRDLAEKAYNVEKFARIGVALTVVAALLHLAGLVSRGLAAGRVPWGNMYEFSVAGSFGVTLMYLLLLRKYSLRWLGLFVTAFSVIVLMLAVLLLYVPAGPLVPALHSYWLVIHVVSAVIAAGAYAVGAIVSALYLVKARAERQPDARTTGYVARLPEASVLDRVAYRVHAFGFPIWTFAALIAGPIWAQYAWGRYWGWDPKEVWAFITWVVYAAYLHARATAGWRGKGAAIIALVGFGTVLFNFIGINLFGSGLHSYSGLG